MDQVLQLLGTYARVHFTEAYTDQPLGHGKIFHTGNTHSIHGKVPMTVDPKRIAEVRFRAGEAPEVYYETLASLAITKKAS